MSLHEYLKCPGLALTLSVRPEEYACPKCGRLVEIWTDEIKRRCAGCGMLVFNPNPVTARMENGSAGDRKPEKPQKLMELTNQAMIMGATDAALIISAAIRIEPELAALCSGNPPCENWGKAPSCPPHVEGPEALIQWREQSPYSIVLRIDVPSEVMFSENRREVMRLLQENVTALEKAAKEMGYARSKAFAGGSCKNVWCQEYADCPVLSEKGPCRYPDTARPSMSGFGVNVARLMESAGWPDKMVAQKGKTRSDGLLWMAGLVLLMK